MQTLLPDLRLAESELIRSVQLFSAAGDESSASLSLCKIADAERMQAKWQAAEQLYNQAYTLAKKVNQVEYQAKILSGRARTESFGLHDYGAAAASAEEAVRLSTASGDKKTLCESLGILTDVQQHRGELTAAADTAQRELRMAMDLNDQEQMIFAYMDLGSVSQALGSKCDYSSAFNNFASCYSALEAAEENYKQALAIAQKLGYLGLTALLKQQLEPTQAARILIQQREATQRRVEESKLLNPTVPRDVLVTEDFSYGGTADAKTSALLSEAYADAARLAEAAGFPVGPGDAYSKGMLASMQGNNDAALAFYLRAADLLDSDRQKLQDEKGRGTFLADKIEIYYRPLMELLRRHRYAEAFNLLERSRSRAFADLLGSKPLQFSNQQEEDLYAQWMAIEANTAKRQAELYSLRAQTAAADYQQRIAADEQEISKLNEQRGILLNRIANSAPKLQNLVTSQPASLEQLQQSMRQEGYEALYYLVLDSAIIVWHISSDSVEVKNIFLSHSVMAKKIASLRESLADPRNKFDEKVAREMFLFLIQPMLPYIHTNRLVIFPQEELNYVPFQVFEDPSDGRYAGERFQLSYASSATVLLRLKQQENIAGAKVLAVADPDLPGAADEVEAIARFYPKTGKIFKRPLVTKSEFKANTAGSDLIHVAVHGKFDATEPLLSYLSLRELGPDDGKLTAAEMFGLHLQNARLVVLSACETGRGQATHSNEIQGMVRSLLYAGANSLILSSWKVDSPSTKMWMEAFYREAQTQALPEAARRALLAVKAANGYTHPYYWAPFVMIGK